MTHGRVIISVIDGLGVGSQNEEFNTYRSIMPHLPVIGGRIQSAIASIANGEGARDTYFSTARINYLYDGADSVAGHLEMLGASLQKRPVFLTESAELLKTIFGNGSLRELDTCVYVAPGPMYVANNIEAELGDALNILVDTKEVDWSDAISAGRKLRSATGCARVIVMGQEGITEEKVQSSISSRQVPGSTLQVTGFIPAVAGAYGAGYKVQHITQSINEVNANNTVSLVRNTGAQVSLIGKVSDICGLEASGIQNKPAVTTHETETALLDALASESKLIIANFQQVDLMGHSRDVLGASREFLSICESLDRALEKVQAEDLFLVIADHGNDPSAPGNSHTQEAVPFVMHSQVPIDLHALAPLGLGLVHALVVKQLNLRLQ